MYGKLCGYVENKGSVHFGLGLGLYIGKTRCENETEFLSSRRLAWFQCQIAPSVACRVKIFTPGTFCFLLPKSCISCYFSNILVYKSSSLPLFQLYVSYLSEFPLTFLLPLLFHHFQFFFFPHNFVKHKTDEHTYKERSQFGLQYVLVIKW